MSDVGGGAPLGFTFVEIRPLATRFNAQAAAAVSPGLAAIDRAFDLKVKSMDKRLQDVGKRMSTFVSLPAAVGLAYATKAASSLVEQGNKVNVVFGAAAKGVNDFASTASEKIGLSERAAKQGAATFGNLFRSVGIAEVQSARMSTTLLRLTADLSSFNEVSNEDVLTALRSGLVGEQEPLRRLGVNLNEARLKQEALRLGLHEGVGVLTANAKAQAAYSIILKDTFLAQGDYERTSGSLANQTKRLQAKFEEAAASVGTKLIPVALKLVQVGGQLIDIFTALPEPVQNIAIIGAVALTAAGPVIYLTGKVLQLRAALLTLPAAGAKGVAGAAAGAAGVAGVSAGGAAAGGAVAGAAGRAAAAGVARTTTATTSLASKLPMLASRLTVVGGALYLMKEAADDARPALEKIEPKSGWLNRILDAIPLGHAFGDVAGKMGDKTKGLSEAVSKSTADLAGMAAGMDRIAGIGIDTGNALEHVGDKAGAAIGPLGSLAGQLDLKPTGLTEALDAYQAKVEAVFAGPMDADRAMRSYLDSVDELQRNLAERAAGTDTNDLRRAQLDLADAQDRLNNARKTGADATRDIADAERDLAKAEREAADVHFNALRTGADPEAARDADEAVADARRRLEDARRVDPRDVARAELDLSDARAQADAAGTKTSKAAQQRETAEALARTVGLLRESVELDAKAGRIPDTYSAKVLAIAGGLDDLLAKFPQLRPQIEDVKDRLGTIPTQRSVDIEVGIKTDTMAAVRGQLDKLGQPITIPVLLAPVTAANLRPDTTNAVAGLTTAPRSGGQTTGSTAGAQVIDQRTITNNTTVNTGSVDPNVIADLIARAQAREAARAR